MVCYAQEKALPGVLMASGGHVFDMLFTIAERDEAKYVRTTRSPPYAYKPFKLCLMMRCRH